MGDMTYIVVFQNLLTPISLCILRPKGQLQESKKDQSQAATRNASIETRVITRSLILRPENQAAGDTTDTTKPDKRRAAESSLPLTTNIVGLEGHDGGDVAVGAGGDEENAKVPNLGIRVESHDGETDEAEHHVEDDNGPTNVVLVASPASEKHNDRSKGIRRRSKAQRASKTKPKLIHQNRRQRERKRIRQGGSIEEDHGISPNLPVGAAPNEATDGKGRRVGVATISLDAANDPGALAGAEELPGLALRVGEVDEEPVADEGEGTGHYAFEDEDPTPAGEAFASFELGELCLPVRSWSS